MPMHDWTRVVDGIYHDFHLIWVSEIKRVLNQDLLSSDYYTIVERVAENSAPAVRTLEELNTEIRILINTPSKNQIAIRTANGDRLVAIIDILASRSQRSPKIAAKYLLRVVESLHQKVHVLTLDPHPPVASFISYEAVEHNDRTFVATCSVGEILPDMPLFLSREKTVMISLEQTYTAAWEHFPKRWQRVIAGE